MASIDFIVSEPVEVGEYCVGNRWVVHDYDKLAELVAYITKGQIFHAQNIIAGLSDSSLANKELDNILRKESIKALTVPKDEDNKEIRGAEKWHRDGLLFEAISWIEARQNAPDNALLKDPHVKPTTQGLDGLMLVLDEETHLPITITIHEDKCKEDSRKAFRDGILPCFKEFHKGEKSRELVSTVQSLLREASISSEDKAKAAGEALSGNIRHYRASLVIENGNDCDDKRCEIFSGYDELDNISSKKRIAATFVTPGELRKWFEEFALLVIKKL